MRHDAHYVEELTQTKTTHVGRLLPIDKLDPNPDQPRTEIGDLTDLTASIKEKGVLEPLLVKPTLSGRWMIIAGERRWRSAQAAGLEEVPCIEMDVDDAEVAEIALIENMQRKDLTPWEEADGLRALSERFGYTHEEIATKIGKSRTTITESLSLAAMPNDIRDLCRRADISSKSLLLQIVRQPTEDEMRGFVNTIRVGGLTRDEARVARKGKAKKEPGFVYKCKAPNQAWALMLKFKKSRASRDDIRTALLAAIADLDAIG